MKKLNFPIVIMSRDGYGFRRIQPDGFIEKKRLGMDWEPSPDGEGNPFIRIERIAGYVETMTKRIGWKLQKGGAQ